MAFKLNKDVLKKQLNRLALGAVIVIAVIYVGATIFGQSKGQEKKVEDAVPSMTGIVTSQYTEDALTTAQEKEKTSIEELRQEIDKLKQAIDADKQTQSKTAVESQTTITALQQKIVELQKSPQIKNVQNQQNSKTAINNSRQVNDTNNYNQMPSYPYQGLNGNGQLGEQEQTYIPRGITTTSFTYKEEITENQKTFKNTVPSGTHAVAVCLSGADTNAGVNGQSDTSPILLRILTEGTMANGKQSTLKGCLITAATYGDVSSERGQIRLQRISCVREDGRVLDIPVEGTVYDRSGQNGIRGEVVMRNGKVLLNAGAAGFLSGVGQAMQQAQQVQTSSLIGPQNSVPPGKVLQYGAYGGAGTAFGKIADYYIKLADLYHPVIQLHAGSVVDVVFLQPFSLDTDQRITATKEVAKRSTQDYMQENVLQKIEQAKLGQTIDGVN